MYINIYVYLLYGSEMRNKCEINAKWFTFNSKFLTLTLGLNINLFTY